MRYLHAIRTRFRTRLDSRALQDAETRAELILSALAASPTCLLLGILAATLVAAFASHASRESHSPAQFAIWSWWFAITVTFGIAFAMVRRLVRKPPPPGQLTHTVLSSARWWVVIIACAIASGSASWLLLPDTDRRTELVVIAFMIALATGHGGSQANYAPLMIRWLLPAMTVFVAGLLRLEEPFYQLVGMGFGVMSVVICIYTTSQSKVARRLIELRRQAEHAMFEAEAARDSADKADRAKTAFLAVVGHDLRQPMHALMQYHAHLGRLNQSDSLVPTIERFGTALASMQDLLNSLLDVSKIAAGSVVPQLEPVRIGDLLDRLDAQMRVLADDKMLRFERGHGDIWIVSDAVLLERILRNLALNAIRYTAEGGLVGIRTSERKGQLVIRVHDSGPGIAHDEREKIFEYFYQIGNDARNRRKGLGLGLAIVRQLSRLLNIQVTLRSKSGTGSIFRLAMPSVECPTATTMTSGRDLRDFTDGARVLLIDDEPSSLDATAATLESFGCQVLQATSAMSALALLQRRETMPHLIVSDYRLEDGTGLEAIELVCSNLNVMFGDDFDIGVLLISGDTANAELETVRNAGVRMLHKPVSVDTLYLAVNQELMSLAHGHGAKAAATDFEYPVA